MRAAGSTDVDLATVALEAVQVGLAAGVGRVIVDGAPAGPRVLVGPIDPCGECDVCRRGGAAVCLFARHRRELGATATVARRWLVELGDGLELPSPAAAAVAGDVALAYTMYARAGVAPREPVVIVGGTPIGRFLIEILLAKGITPVALDTAAIAHPEPWRTWLDEKGIPTGTDRERLGGELVGLDIAAGGVAGRPWRLFCVEPAALTACLSLAGPRSTVIVLFGTAPPSAALPDGAAAAIAASALAQEVNIVGVAGAHPDLVVEAAALCAKGEIDLAAGTATVADPLRTHVRTAA